MVEIQDATAVVFVNTRCKSKLYEVNGLTVEGQVAAAQTLFSHVFEIADIRVFKDLTKKQVEEQFD